MEHFQIIQSLCRVALGTGSAAAAVRKQVERLRDALREQGDDSAARSLDQLLGQAARTSEMAPSRLTQSRSYAGLAGEELSRNTPLPVDRETAAPLADILFPGDMPQQPPLFHPHLATAADTLIEEWRNLEALQALGVQPARTCLIYGPPGTGKTTLALWLANQLQLPAVVARLDGLISSFLGTTARNASNLFTFANRYRCVLILDEFDAIAKVRDDPNEVGEIKRVVNALLQNVDARRSVGLTIAITNHEALLDPAIWRRFELQLQIPLPTAEARLAIIQRYLPPLELTGATAKFLCWFLDGLSGAEIETFVTNLKKHIAVTKDDAKNPLPMIRQLALVNGSRLDKERIGLLELEPPFLAQRLHVERGEGTFTQAELGDLFGKDRTTISRWLKAA